MARPDSKHPTPGELPILAVQRKQRASRLRDTCAHLSAPRKPAPSTVATLLKII